MDYNRSNSVYWLCHSSFSFVLQQWKQCTRNSRDNGRYLRFDTQARVLWFAPGDLPWNSFHERDDIFPDSGLCGLSRECGSFNKWTPTSNLDLSRTAAKTIRNSLVNPPGKAILTRRRNSPLWETSLWMRLTSVRHETIALLPWRNRVETSAPSSNGGMLTH